MPTTQLHAEQLSSPPQAEDLLRLLFLPLLSPSYLPLFVFRRHPERSEGPPHWLLPLPVPPDEQGASAP
jgi:hypothetical protein